jgi:hypothetical protein
MRFGIIVLRSSTRIAVEVFTLPAKLIVHTSARISAIVQVRTLHGAQVLTGWLLRPLGQRMFAQYSRMRTAVCRCRLFVLAGGMGRVFGSIRARTKRVAVCLRMCSHLSKA